jgi:hypothetical protein
MSGNVLPGIDTKLFVLSVGDKEKFHHSETMTSSSQLSIDIRTDELLNCLTFWELEDIHKTSYNNLTIIHQPYCAGIHNLLRWLSVGTSALENT